MEAKYLNSVIMTAYTCRNIYCFVAHFMITVSVGLHCQEFV